MNPNEMAARLATATNKLKQYMLNQFPKMAGGKVLRFIDGNFRAQGFQGPTFQKWKRIRRKGTILINKGHLRRSYGMKTGPGMVRVYSNSKYAAVHNRGFRGRVTVKAHSRRKLSARKVGTGRFTATGRERTRTVHEVSKIMKVKSHTRNVNIPKRQVMPEKQTDAPALMDNIRKEAIQYMQSLF